MTGTDAAQDLAAENGRLLGTLFHPLFLEGLFALHEAGRLAFFGGLAHLAEPRAFLRHLAPVRTKRWVVYAKPPFAGPGAVLAYLSRYTHRVAIANGRLVALDAAGVTFRTKDYRRDGAARYATTTLATHEFIQRFLLHVLPKGFHRIRHYGPLASATRRANLARIRELLTVPSPFAPPEPGPPPDRRPPCPYCGERMTVVEIFGRFQHPRGPPTASAPTWMRAA